MSDTSIVTDGRTYRGHAEVERPPFDTVAGVVEEKRKPAYTLEIERHDTDDRRLAAAGIALVVQRGRPGEPAFWELDLPDGAGREQLRVSIPPDDVAAPALPPELLELVRGFTRGQPIRPAALVRTVREVIRLRGARGRRLAELSHDRHTLVELAGGTEVASWTEVVVAPGADGPLAEIVALLVAAGLRPAVPAVVSELDRMVRPAERVSRAGRPGSAGAALVEYLATHTDRLAAEELRVRRNEPDSVHQLRVAARRLRSALQAYRPLLDAERIAPIIADLRDFAGELSPARDAEVLDERISAALAALDPALLLGPVQAQTTRYFARAEAEGWAGVLSALDGERYARLRSALDQLIARPPLTARAKRPAAQELPRQVARTARRMERAVQVAIDPAQDPVSRELATHDARKAGKRLRYATEVARPAVGRPAVRFAKAMKSFQDALGEHQDTVVAREALRELAAQAHPAGENGFSFGLLYAQDAATAARIEQQLPELWAQAWTPQNRCWLA